MILDYQGRAERESQLSRAEERGRADSGRKESALEGTRDRGQVTRGGGLRPPEAREGAKGRGSSSLGLSQSCPHLALAQPA